MEEANCAAHKHGDFRPVGPGRLKTSTPDDSPPASQKTVHELTMHLTAPLPHPNFKFPRRPSGSWGLWSMSYLHSALGACDKHCTFLYCAQEPCVLSGQQDAWALRVLSGLCAQRPTEEVLHPRSRQPMMVQDWGWGGDGLTAARVCTCVRVLCTCARACGPHWHWEGGDFLL